MATIEFKSVITDEAVAYARFASKTAGWSLKPKKWAITTAAGELVTSRPTDSMYTPWISQPFSGIYLSGNNKLVHSLVIPPNAYATDMNIGEVYFIYEDYYGNEFLFAIAQPTTTLTFNNGVAQSYSFIFTLNNTNVPDTISFDYTYPQDIEDHNRKPDSHEYLLARDGSRKATGRLSYQTSLSFTNNRDIVDKEYVDKQNKSIKDYVEDQNKIVQDSVNESLGALDVICPPGSMMWWPKSTAPSGWLIRNGAAISRTTYAKLFKVIGTIYGTGDGSTTFNLPDDRGRFIRGYLSGTTANFGQAQGGGLPNITAQWSSGNTDGGYHFTGATYNAGSGGTSGRRNPQGTPGITFDASRSSALYGAANEVRPINRNYLPIIKY